MLRSLGFASKMNNSAYSLVSRLYKTIEFSSISFHKWNKNEKFECSHYIETADIAKVIKVGSLDASQKWSFDEKKIFFSLKDYFWEAWSDPILMILTISTVSM